MRNERLIELDRLIGEWELTLSGAWFLDSLDTRQLGRATFEWMDDAFVVMRSSMEGEPTWDFVFGRSDPLDQTYALYHDSRGVSRLFTMTFDSNRWAMSREDPDFHQRFLADVEPDRIRGHWDASDDGGQTWRKDFDLWFDRVDT
ncbi:MAG TPA: hypothetical protein VHL52_01120 [Acidimicrobiia bacterium]|nr:hypothetical protein [Acidimicrobiia bacterium]